MTFHQSQLLLRGAVGSLLHSKFRLLRRMNAQQNDEMLELCRGGSQSSNEKVSLQADKGISFMIKYIGMSADTSLDTQKSRVSQVGANAHQSPDTHTWISIVGPTDSACVVSSQLVIIVAMNMRCGTMWPGGGLTTNCTFSLSL